MDNIQDILDNMELDRVWDQEDYDNIFRKMFGLTPIN